MLHSRWGLGGGGAETSGHRQAGVRLLSLSVGGAERVTTARPEAGLGEATARAEGKGLLTMLWRRGPRGQAGVDSLTRQSPDQTEANPCTLMWGRAGGS